MGSSGQVWELTQVKNEEYCISRHHEGLQQIVWGGYTCYIYEYKEENKQQENNCYRWLIEKRGKDEKGQQIYSIMNINDKRRMNYDDDGSVVLPNLNH